MITIYAEKPDMGTKIAAALDKITINNGMTVNFSELEANMDLITRQRSRDGYFKIRYNGEDCYVTWGIGHMCELKQAQDYNPEYKQWRNLPLPYIPESYDLKICDDAAEGSMKKKQFDVIKRLFEKSDTIICATDDDREGDLIFWYIYDYLNCKKPFKRALFNQQTKEEFKKSFAWSNLVSGVARNPVINAGRARSASDFIVGAGPTVAMTLKYGSKQVLSVGRVQTAVLNMIVERELEIKNFKPQKFWVISAKFTTPDGEIYEAVHKSKRFEKEPEADSVIAKIQGKQGKITDIKKKDVTKKRPMLYSLVSLQIAANKRYGFSAQKTLEIVQRLYEKGYTTYPRTDSAFLPEDMTDTMDEVLSMIAGLDKYKDLFPDIYNNFKTKEYFDNKKIQSHFAIVPTIVEPAKMTADEEKIYDMIARAVICMAHENAIVSETVITTDVDGEEFLTKGNMIKKPGFYVVTGKPKEVGIPDSVELDLTVDGEYGKTVGHTEPPKKFTEGTLLKAMENCGKTIKDAELREIMAKGPDGKPRSLGRPSSQASILSTLKKRGYVAVTGKTLNPTEKGMLLIKCLPVEDLKSAEMTALWEKRLDDIEHGNDTYDNFMSDMEENVRKWTNEIINTEVNYKMAKAVITNELKCPVCKKALKESEKSFYCSGKFDKSCDFFISKTMGGKKIPDKAIKDLVEKGKTGLIRGFKSSKNDEKYDAFLYVDKKEQRVKMKFPERTVPDDPAFKCPKCGSRLKPVKWGYGCIKYPECKWSIGQVFGVSLDDDQIKALLEGEKVYIRNMQPKDPSKSTFSANMILDKETGYVKFAPEDTDTSSDEPSDDEFDDYEGYDDDEDEDGDYE